MLTVLLVSGRISIAHGLSPRPHLLWPVHEQNREAKFRQTLGAIIALRMVTRRFFSLGCGGPQKIVLAVLNFV